LGLWNRRSPASIHGGRVRALVSQANNGIKGDGKKPLVSIGDIEASHL